MILFKFYNGVYRMAFEGFSAQTVSFLKENKRQNSRDWYNSHKDIFRQYVQQPFYDLVEALAPCLTEIDSKIVTVPRYCLCHVYRDTRFSKDKSTLYRDNMWLTFKRPSREWTQAPCFYFELLPDSFRYGMGYYSATPHTMMLYRRYIEWYPDSFREKIKPLRSLALDTEFYKRKFSESYPEDLKEWYISKNVHVSGGQMGTEGAYTKDLVQIIIQAFLEAAPLYHLMSQLPDMPELTQEETESPLVPKNRVEFEW